MIDLREANEILCKSQWLPGWNLYLRQHPEGIMLIVTSVQPDYSNPQDVVELRIESILSPNDLHSEQTLLDYLDWRLARIAKHESHEAFRFKGRTWNSPHAEGYK